MSLVMRTQTCDYCEATSERWITTYSRLHGIKCCGQHMALGERDVNAHLRQEGLVRQKDFLAIHPRLTDMKLNVPRTDGSITSGGNLSQEPFEVLTKDDEGWRIRVLFRDPVTKEILNKMMKVRDLGKSGISEEEIATWIKTLDDFYAEDYAAHEAVAAVGEKLVDKDPPFIEKAYVGAQEVRFFRP